MTERVFKAYQSHPTSNMTAVLVTTVFIKDLTLNVGFSSRVLTDNSLRLKSRCFQDSWTDLGATSLTTSKYHRALSETNRTVKREHHVRDLPLYGETLTILWNVLYHSRIRRAGRNIVTQNRHCLHSVKGSSSHAMLLPTESSMPRGFETIDPAMTIRTPLISQAVDIKPLASDNMK